MDNNSPCYFRNSFVAPPFYPRYGEKWTLDSHTNIYPMHDVKTAKLNVRNFMFIQNIFHQLSPEPLEGGGRRDPLFTPEVWLSRSLFIPREHISFRCEPGEEKRVPRNRENGSGQIFGNRFSVILCSNNWPGDMTWVFFRGWFSLLPCSS